MERSKVMTIQKFKEAFKFVFPEIKEMFYYVDEETAEEYVRVDAGATFNYNFPGEGPIYHFNINVSADSTTAMIDDVWKELKRRFA